MKTIVFITPADAEYGYRLAGLRQVITDEQGIEDALTKTVSDPDTGLIIIDERLLSVLPEERLRQLEKNFPGIILDLPAPRQAEAVVEDYAANLIRRAIGYHVKLKL